MKMIDKEHCSAYWFKKPNKCCICGEPAQYIGRVFSLLRGVRVFSICEKCMCAWDKNQVKV